MKDICFTFMMIYIEATDIAQRRTTVGGSVGGHFTVDKPDSDLKTESKVAYSFNF